MPKVIEQYTKEPFVLYYTLKNYAETKNDLTLLVKLASKKT